MDSLLYICHPSKCMIMCVLGLRSTWQYLADTSVQDIGKDLLALHGGTC